MDGVLIDSEPLWQRCEIELLRELGIHITPEMQEATLGLTTEAMLNYWHLRYSWNSPSDKVLGKRYEDRMEVLLRTEVPLMEGAEEVVRFFIDKNIPVALASCSNMSLIDAFLDRFGFRDLFDPVVSAADGQFGKPHPAVYLETATRLGIDPTQCLVIEDTFHGMIAAKAARMKTVVIPRGKEYDQLRFGAADLKIRTMHELNNEALNKLQLI